MDKYDLYNKLIEAAQNYTAYISSNNLTGDSINLVSSIQLENGQIDSVHIGGGLQQMCAGAMATAMDNFPEYNSIVSAAVVQYKKEKDITFSKN